MIVTAESLDGLFRGFSVAFNNGLGAPETAWSKVSMLVPSDTSSQTYAWLGQAAQMREWLGDRVVKSLAAYGYTVENRKFELTQAVERTMIEDDQYGVFSPLMTEMGRSVAVFPDELIFGLLAAGFTSRCFDGQNFFDTEHPVNPAGGDGATYSNVLLASTDPNNPIPAAPAPWYLMDTTRGIRPLVFQERTKPELTRLDQPGNPNVFWRDEYVYGARRRCNAGFGLPQLAYASTAALTLENFLALRQNMMQQVGDGGRRLGIVPNMLVCGPSNEGAARAVLKAAVTAATTNVWQGAADIVMTPYLA